MKTVKIVRGFTFNHPDRRLEYIPAGEHEMDDAMADHWFVRAHSDNPPEQEPQMGTPEYAETRVTRRRRLKDDQPRDEPVSGDAKIEAEAEKERFASEGMMGEDHGGGESHESKVGGFAAPEQE